MVPINGDEKLTRPQKGVSDVVRYTNGIRADSSIDGYLKFVLPQALSLDAFRYIYSQAQALLPAGFGSPFIERYYGISNVDPIVQIYPNGTGQVDMRLQWMSIANEQTHLVGALDAAYFSSSILPLAIANLPYALDVAASGQLMAPPNYRWLAMTEAAGREVARIMNTTSQDFLFVPGVTSSGLQPEELDLLKQRIGVPGKRIVFGHSAGTDALLDSLPYMTDQVKANTVFIFASPRMAYDDFSRRIDAVGLRKEQVIVIQSSGDLPSDYVVDANGFMKLSLLGANYPQYTKNSYGNNPTAKYRHMYLIDDLSYNANNLLRDDLKHGAGYEGLLDYHTYIMMVDRVRLEIANFSNELKRAVSESDLTHE